MDEDAVLAAVMRRILSYDSDSTYGAPYVSLGGLSITLDGSWFVSEAEEAVLLRLDAQARSEAR